jgi:hypothetical protein
MAVGDRVWVVQIDGSIPPIWDLSPDGRRALERTAAGVGPMGSRSSLELLDDLHAFRFLLVLPGHLRRPADIAQASREGLQDAVTKLRLVGTSLVWRTFDVLADS